MKRMCCAFLLCAALFTACSQQRVDAPTSAPAEESTAPTAQVITATEPTFTAADLAGTWILDSEQNQMDQLRVLFGSSLSLGTGMRIDADGAISYSIGAGAGGAGTFTLDGTTLHARMTTYAEGNTEDVVFTVVPSGNGCTLVQQLDNILLYWVKGDIPDTTQQTITTEVTIPTETTPSVDYIGQYRSVLELYARAVSENWDAGTCMDKGVNYLVATAKNYGTIGYCLRDVSEDGTPELLIGSCDEPLIYAMYTLQNGRPVQVIDAGERSSYYLEPDNIIVNRGSNSAACSGYNFYWLRGTKLELNIAIYADYSYDANNPYFQTTSENWNPAKDKHISNEYAEKTIRAYETNYVSLPYQPLSSFSA